MAGFRNISLDRCSRAACSDRLSVRRVRTRTHVRFGTRSEKRLHAVNKIRRKRFLENEMAFRVYRAGRRDNRS